MCLRQLNPPPLVMFVLRHRVVKVTYILFFNTRSMMSRKRPILSWSLDQRIEVIRRLDEAHRVERLLASWCGKTQMARIEDSKQTRLPFWASGIRATGLILNICEAPKDDFFTLNKRIRVLYLSCYVASIDFRFDHFSTTGLLRCDH